MSSANISRRAIVRVLAVTAGAGALAGCFTPLYGDPNVVPGARGAQSYLQNLEIPEIPGRSGVVLRNELIY
ncbi:hypothetical protein, partial [Acinetobacter baumannii]|uniref:hypothetical protein n=1 Tax=Acinetobacter baumannii TaxID=470 RepID=UPI001C0864AD